MSGRVAPYHCPYCAGEDLHPRPGGGWTCRECARAFKVEFLGLDLGEARTPVPAVPGNPDGTRHPHGTENRDDT